MKTNADAIVDALERIGTRYVFGYPGGQNARFIEALHGSRVRFILVAHEASAGFMADIYSRLTGGVGACLSTLGPGATNMTTGVGNAFLDRVPVLAFTAKMAGVWRGRTVQMQIDHARLYAPLTKWSAELKSGRIRATLDKAVAVARAEQPGPVHLDMPEDVIEAPAADDAFEARLPVDEPPAVDAAAMSLAEDLLKKARRPLVAIGLTMNRARATAALRRFIEKHRLPVVCTLMAKGHVDDLPSYAGTLGRARRDLVAECCEPADLVISFGYDPVEFNYEDWLRPETPLIHVDTVPADIGPGYAVPAQIVGDIGRTLEEFLRIPAQRYDWDVADIVAHRERLFAALAPEQRAFAPHQALQAMREILPSRGILVSDVGAHTHLIGQLWDPRGPGNFLVSNGWSSMGFGIPSAIAAKLVQPDRPVVACVGDGGFLMNLGEINTAVRLGLPVVFVVLRDSFLSLIKVKQGRKNYHHDGVELFGPQYASPASLFGARVVVADTESAFRDALRSGLQGTLPTVIEAVVDPSEYEQVI